MKFSERLRIGNKILFNKIVGKKYLLSVNFAVTHRCNFRCKYCNFWKSKVRDMPTEKVLSIISQLSELGTHRIQFTGGEPLLRKDIKKILEFTHGKGITTVLNTNGWLLENKLREVRHASQIQISLDGNEKVHDSQRRKFSYRRIIRAARLLGYNNTPFGFNMLLNNKTLSQVDFMLETAKEYKAYLYLQPVQWNPYSADISRMIPKPEELRAAVKKVLEAKKNNVYVGNSYQFLNALMKYPYSSMKCKGGELFARIDADGRLVPCHYYHGKNFPSLKSLSLADAFTQLKQQSCKGCFDSCYVEYNNIISLNPSTITHFTRIVK